MNNLRWEDMVFASRNQSYGAYVLRKAYPGRVAIAFGLAMSFGATILAYPSIKPLLFGVEKIIEARQPTSVEFVFQPVPPIKLDELPKPPKVNSQTIQLLPPRITDKEIAEPEIVTIDDFKDALDQGETGDVEYSFTGTGLEAPAEIKPVEPEFYTWVEQQPEFPGGVKAMMDFISKNIKYPSSARRQEIQGQVFISFMVNPDGTIGEVQTIKGIYAECDQEAMRVISKMPAWKPGKQNGKAVKVKFVLPINFRLS